jgi:hypothetical protein
MQDGGYSRIQLSNADEFNEDYCVCWGNNKYGCSNSTLAESRAAFTAQSGSGLLSVAAQMCIYRPEEPAAHLYLAVREPDRCLMRGVVYATFIDVCVLTAACRHPAHPSL